ncbi:hypothetical protein [Bradyrhizobium sp. HKCCYLS20291]|uniref:hypothetical protein n=1 Tax=Bradyrhizobium sp. HKCCYLS20291 TaxID=3420766 RepID=UPI003EB80ED1
MTYAALSEAVGFPVNSQTSGYRSAVNIVLRDGVSIMAGEAKRSFRRRADNEMAEGKHRFGTIRRTARKGSFEAREAMKSNDKRTQAKASIASAKYAMIRSIKPVSNRDVPDDKI